MQFRVATLLYIIALLAVGITALGPWRAVVATTVVVLMWANVKPTTPRRNVIIFTFIVALLVPVLLARSSRLFLQETKLRGMCAYNLKQIALALLNYESTHGRAPPAYIKGPDGEPMHSWRVLILPYLDEMELYEAYDFDEPWDGPNNRKLVDRMPELYRCPSCDACARVRGNPLGVSTGACTNYLAAVSDETALRPEFGTGFSDVTDGMSNTIVVLECAGKQTNWMAPDDLAMGDAVALLSDPKSLRHVAVRDEYFVTRYLTGGGNVALMDGAVIHAPTLAPEDARALLTIAGGEPPIKGLSGPIESRTALVTINWRRVFPFCMFVALAALPAFRRTRAALAPDDALPSFDDQQVKASETP